MTGTVPSSAPAGGGGWWFRSSPVLRWGAVPVVLSVLLTLANAGDVDAYWLAVSARSTIGVVALAPGLALLAAWEAGRWRGWRVGAGRLRSGLAVAAGTLGMTLGLAVVAVALNLLVLTLDVPEVAAGPGGPRVGVLVAAVTVLLAHAVAGYVAGMLLPRGVAVPLSLGASFAWLAYPPAFEPFWIRNVTGNLGTSCCALDQELPIRALWAPVLVSAAVIVGSLVVIVIEERWRPTAAVLAVVVVAAGVAGARPLVADLGPDPVLPRRAAMTCQTAQGVTVCAYPEHAELLSAGAPVIRDVLGRLDRAGVDTPALVTEQPEPAQPAWSVRIDVVPPVALRGLLAGQVLADVPPDCSQHRPWPAQELTDPAGAYLAVVAGVPVDDATAALSDAQARQLAAVLERGPRARARWARSAVAALRSCDPLPAGLRPQP